MSGIFGVFHREGGTPDPGMVTRAMHAMRHRAVDRSATLPLGEVTLGHLMFETTPYAVGEQLPGTDPGSDLSITSDVRLDNRDELAGVFGVDHGVPDSELLLRAYQHWGESCVEHLLGDFAFAIHDARRGHIFCARDHMGVKPFYYFLSREWFGFASEIRPLKAAFGDRVSVNALRIADYLLNLEYSDATSTFFSEVERLPAAHVLRVGKDSGADKDTPRRYWTLATTTSNAQCDRDYVQAFSEVLEHAVASRLRGVKQVGCLLSGGIDSAAVIAVAHGQSAGAVTAFSGTNPDHENGDAVAIDRVLKHIGCQSHATSTLTGEPDNLTDVMSNLDDPFTAQLTLAYWLYLDAAKQGMRVMLDGVEGDLVMSLSRDYPQTLVREGQLLRARHELMAMAANNRVVRQNFARYALKSMLPRWLSRQRSLRAPARWLNTLLTDSVLSPQLRNDPALARRHLALRETRFTHHTSMNELYRWWLGQPFIPIAMERYDRAAAVCGVEARHPLLDKRVVEFCASLPWNLKARDGWSKWILRTSMGGRLPQAVIWRTDKPHYGGDFTEAWIRLHWDDVRASIVASEDLWCPYAAPERVLPWIPAQVDADTDFTIPLRIYHLSRWLAQVD